MARKLRVLVLDEFFVSDIGDAMLLGACWSACSPRASCW
jgi:predicted ATPase